MRAIKQEKTDAIEPKKPLKTPKFTLLSYMIEPQSWLNLKTKKKKYVIGPFKPPLVKIESDSDDAFVASGSKEKEKKKKATPKRRKATAEKKKKELLTSPTK